MTRLRRLTMLGTAVATIACAGDAPGQQNTSARTQAPTDTAPTIDTSAVNALKRMGTYLRTLNAFQIEADVTTEEVLRDGQKVQLENHVQLVASRPNRLRVEVSSDRKERLFVFDGKQFTLFAPRQKFYSTIDAPPTIVELATLLEDKYDVDLPLVDLFRWGTSDEQIRAIRAAKNIGPSTIDDITCQHYAFRQDGLDWQVWIQNGAYPLPLRIVLTTLTDEARPQHRAQYSWNLAPSFNEAAFAVQPPDDFKKIAMAEVASARNTTRNPGGSQR